MRRFSLILIIFLSWACREDHDPGRLTSINGYWIVRTPDDVTRVTFRIGVDSNNEPVIENAAVTHLGKDYNSQPIEAELIPVSSTEIESITFRTTEFVIRFLDISVNSDFTEMQITHSIFTIDGVIREFSPIAAERR